MTGNTDAWAVWMTGLGILSVIVIFGLALYWVNSIKKGNRGLRRQQVSAADRNTTSTPHEEGDYSETREDLR